MPVDWLVIPKGRFRTQIGTDGRPNFERGRTHDHVNVFEDLAWSDATAAVRGFDQVVTGLATVFATEGIDEGEGLGELFGFDQEPSAIDVPFCGRFPHCAFIPGGGK